MSMSTDQATARQRPSRRSGFQRWARFRSMAIPRNPLDPSCFPTIGKRKLQLAWKKQVLNPPPSLMKQIHLLPVSFQQQAAGKLRLQRRAGGIDLAQILVVSIIMDAILPGSEPA